MIDITKEFRNEEGLLHNEDGPAVIYENGTKKWFKNGELHRVNAPAIIWNDGTEEWLENGHYVK